MYDSRSHTKWVNMWFFCIYEDICILTMLTLKWCLRGWKTTVPSPVSNIYSNSQITEDLYCFFPDIYWWYLGRSKPMQAAQSLWRKGRSKNWMIYDAQKKKRKEQEHISISTNKEALLGLHNACVMHCKLLVLAVLKQCIYTPFLNIYILNSEWIHLFVAWSCNVCFKKPPTVFFLYLKKEDL